MTSWRAGIVACLVLVPVLAAGAQKTGAASPTDSVALAVAVFRTAIVHGQLTAHGEVIPEVLCLATWMPRPGERYGEPDSIIVARVHDQFPTARPMSACRVEPRQSVVRNTSMVVETATGRRGLVIWMETPKRDSTGTGTVHIGYFEHGLSGADWICAVRRRQSEWIVNACREISIS